MFTKQQMVGGGIALTVVVALFVFWPFIVGDRADRAASGGDLVPALNKNDSGNVPSPPQPRGGCIPPDKGLLKDIQARTSTLDIKAEQVSTLAGLVSSHRAAYESADPTITSPAKINSLRGAYEQKLARYERFRAQYEAERLAIAEKVNRYNALVSNYNACSGRASAE